MPFLKCVQQHHMIIRKKKKKTDLRKSAGQKVLEILCYCNMYPLNQSFINQMVLQRPVRIEQLNRNHHMFTCSSGFSQGSWNPKPPCQRRDLATACNLAARKRNEAGKSKNKTHSTSVHWGNATEHISGASDTPFPAWIQAIGGLI